MHLDFHKHIWKGKIPPKINIFLWLMENNPILTKDNLIKRGWVGDPKCVFFVTMMNLYLLNDVQLAMLFGE
jgi:hypothetical protein